MLFGLLRVARPSPKASAAQYPPVQKVASFVVGMHATRFNCSFYVQLFVADHRFLLVSLDEYCSVPSMTRLPEWIRLPLSADNAYADVCAVLKDLGLNTVCVSAKCPNRVECWNRGTATFMILGDSCSRNCLFCAVRQGQPQDPDKEEPFRVAEAVDRLQLRHVVLTSVTRDDLTAGGAEHFRAVIEAIRERCPGVTIEVLTPDFQGRAADINLVLDASPDVYAHNLETVERLQNRVRPQAAYDRSLRVLRLAADHPDITWVKSGLMVGLGETDEEVEKAMEELYAHGCRLLTVGQYLAPTRRHWPVHRYVPPAQFRQYAERAFDIGFKGVESGPLVRSSYHAERISLSVNRPYATKGVQP